MTGCVVFFVWYNCTELLQGASTVLRITMCVSFSRMAFLKRHSSTRVSIEWSELHSEGQETTSNTFKYGQNSWRVFLMTSCTECASSRYLEDALLGEDIVSEMAWKDSLISTTVVTPVSLSHFIPLLHTSQRRFKGWELRDVVCAAGSANSRGNL